MVLFGEGAEMKLMMPRSGGIKPKVRIPSPVQRYKSIPVGNLFLWEVCQSIF